jgi:maintenance of mitochondrial morphology protein 1
MGSAYMFSLQPTFTQGFILGQFSILALLALVLKYLFFDTEHSQTVPVYAERDPPILQPTLPSALEGENSLRIESESTEWLNTLFHQESTCHGCASNASVLILQTGRRCLSL